MRQVIPVIPETAFRFEAFTYPRLRGLIARDISPSTIALGATVWGKPVGLVLGQATSDRGIARLLSIRVDPAHRGAGIGASLVTALEGELRLRGCATITSTYLGDSELRPAAEALLRHAGWDVGRPQTIVYRAEITRTMANLEWIRQFRLPRQYEFSSWSEVTGQDRIDILSHRDRLQYPEDLSPFFEEHSIEQNSVVLRQSGEIVGWHLTHRVLPDTIRYTRMFVRHDLRKLARGCALIAEAVRRHAAGPLAKEAPNGFFHVRADNHDMRRFVDRRLAPAIDSAAITYEARKDLRQGTK